MSPLKVRLTLADLQARRHEILRIAAAHGAHGVRVFGSVARGQARPDSDVDFLVEFEPGRTVLDLSGLILDLQDALGREVNVVEVGRLSRLTDQIEREAVPL
jgi:predicted nucleotidyltransferase